MSFPKLCRLRIPVLRKVAKEDQEKYNLCLMKNEPQKQSVPSFVIIGFGIVLVAIVAFALLRGKNAPTQTKSVRQTESVQPDQKDQEIIADPAAPLQSAQQESPDFRVPAFHHDVASLTLPPVLDPTSVAPEARAAYTIVKNKPKLIAQLPCFCYCERWGHGSLHDCFVTEHAVTCDVCMNEAIQADQLDRQGMPAAEIRETIVAQYKKDAADDHEGHAH